MKKTISMLLAVLMTALVACTFSMTAFADEATTVAANDDPTDAWVATTAAPTTVAPTTAAPTTAAPTTTAAATTEAASEEATTNIIGDILGGIGDLIPDETVTLAPGQTVIDEGDATTAAAPATTKKPAKVESNIPSTGSGILVPAIALLALAAGTVAVVKTKKED